MLIDDAGTDDWIRGTYTYTPSYEIEDAYLHDLCFTAILADADLNTCPLNEISLLDSEELQDMQVKMNETIATLAQTSTSAAVSAMYSSVQQQMGSLIELTTTALTSGGNSSMRLNQTLPLVGFTNMNISLPRLNVFVTEFIQQELRLWDTIRDGSALSHHMEPSYYLALAKAINSSTLV